MASSATALSVSEYLETTYRPDCELIDGELLERNVGEYDHANLQGALIALLRARQRDWNIRALPEQRLQVSASRFRIPDVCVVSRNQPIEPVFTRPPLVGSPPWLDMRCRLDDRAPGSHPRGSRNTDRDSTGRTLRRSGLSRIPRCPSRKTGVVQKQLTPHTADQVWIRARFRRGSILLFRFSSARLGP